MLLLYIGGRCNGKELVRHCIFPYVMWFYPPYKA